MAPVKKRRKLAWIVGIVLLACAFFAWRHFWGSTAQKPEMPRNIAPVRVAEAIVQNVPHYLNGLGTVIPSSDVLVKSRVDGQLLRLHFEDGQRVKAGDLLAEIDPRPFQAALEQAQGTLARDKAQLDNARRDLARYAKLAKGDFIAEQQYENQRALVRQYEGTVESDKAAVDSARLQVEYSKITAPTGGRLGLRVVDEGNQVKASDSGGIVRITETSPCDVIFTLPENRLPLVVQAMRQREANPQLAPLQVDAWNREDTELLAQGELISLDNQIDAATGTVKLKARFPNRDDRLFPNQFVNIRLLVQTIENALTVPAAAIQLGAKGSYCYVIEKAERNGETVDVAQFREIVPGIITEGIEIVDKGLKAGELVAVDGLDRLREGIRVRVAATMETPRLEDAANSATPAGANGPGNPESGK